MIYHIAAAFQSSSSLANIMHYVSFRSVAGLLTALVLSLVAGERFIAFSRTFFRAKAREWTPENHKMKDDTPTMGGVFITLVIVVSTLLWVNLANPQVWVFLFCLMGFGTIGGLDDWQKITKRKGISAAVKFKLQCLVGFFTAFLLYCTHTSTELYLPFIKSFHPAMGLLFIPWAMVVLVATSNAVNLTDGLDGLACSALIPNFAAFGIISYLTGHIWFSHYLYLPFTANCEMTVISAILVGATLGFLWYNAYPAQIFMGDVGSLALGASLALIALVAKQELLLLFAGFLFVIEALSVIIQVYSYRYLGKRLFKMAPIHHHFELLGWPESKITTRFGIISLIACLLTLLTLKIR